MLPLGDGGGGFGRLVCDTFPTMCVQLAVPILEWRRRRERLSRRSAGTFGRTPSMYGHFRPVHSPSKTSLVSCATVSTSAIIFRCSFAPTIRPLRIYLVLLFPVHTRACLASIPPDAYVRCPLSGPHAGCNEHMLSFRWSSSLLFQELDSPWSCRVPSLSYSCLLLAYSFVLLIVCRSIRQHVPPFSLFFFPFHLRKVTVVFHLPPWNRRSRAALWPDPADAAYRGLHPPLYEPLLLRRRFHSTAVGRWLSGI